jgi:hypothetical protein
MPKPKKQPLFGLWLFHPMEGQIQNPSLPYRPLVTATFDTAPAVYASDV